MAKIQRLFLEFTTLVIIIAGAVSIGNIDDFFVHKNISAQTIPKELKNSLVPQ